MFGLQHSKSKSMLQQKSLALTQLFKINKLFLSNVFHNRREKNSKCAKEIKSSSPDYQTQEIICSMNCKTFLRIWTLTILFYNSVKEIENSSVDYQTKEIVCSLDCKTF